MDTPFIQIDRGMGVPGSLWFSQTAPSQLIGQPDTTYAQQQSGNDARRDIRCGARPLAIFQHLGCFPSEARERGVAAKEAHGNSHAPVWREDHAIQSELADHAEQKAACQIYEQRAIRKSACHTNLHEALQAVPRQRANRPENRNQRETQFLSNLPGHAGVSTAGRSICKQKTPGALLPGVIRPGERRRDGYGELHRLPKWCFSLAFSRTGERPIQ